MTVTAANGRYSNKTSDSFSVTASDGDLGQATRTVEVSFTGVTVTVTGGTAATWIRVWIDGQPAPSVSVSGTIVAPGSRLVFSGEKRVEIRSGDPDALLYSSSPHKDPQSSHGHAGHQLRVINFNGHNWALDFDFSPSIANLNLTAAWIGFGIGLVVSTSRAVV